MKMASDPEEQPESTEHPWTPSGHGYAVRVPLEFRGPITIRPDPDTKEVEARKTGIVERDT